MSTVTPPQMPLHRRTLLAALVMAGPAIGAATTAPAGRPVLHVSGRLRLADPAGQAFDMERLAALPQREFRTRTPWHAGMPAFSGPLVRDLLTAVQSEGQVLRMHALNHYRVDIPVDDVLRYDVILARLIDGRPIAVRDKGPLFVMYPFEEHPELRNTVYFGRCIWQLNRIEVR